MTYLDRSRHAGGDASEQLVAAIRATLDTCDTWPGHSLPGLLADALVAVAVEAGDVAALTRHHPSGHEADAVRQLALGAQALIDEKLAAGATAAGHLIEVHHPVIGQPRQVCSCTWSSNEPGAWRSHARSVTMTTNIDDRQ